MGFGKKPLLSGAKRRLGAVKVWIKLGRNLTKRAKKGCEKYLRGYAQPGKPNSTMIDAMGLRRTTKAEHLLNYRKTEEWKRVVGASKGKWVKGELADKKRGIKQK